MDDELLFRFLMGKAGEAETEAVEAWRRSSPENERDFQEFTRVHALAVRAEAALEPGKAPSAAALIQRAEVRGVQEKDARLGLSRRWSTWLRRSAGVAAAVAIGFALSELRRSPAGETEFTAEEFVADVTAPATVLLSDGTLVRLAPRARLRFAPQRERRDVFLDGRAFFAVARDGDDRPFRVRTGAGEAVVLGTRFEVSAQGDELRVVVVEGAVALSGSENRVTVSAGKMSQVVNGRALEPITIPDLPTLLGWMGDFLAFQATPLRQAVAEMERHYGARIDIADSTLANRTVTTWFTRQSFEEAMEIVCVIVEARCMIGDTEATIAAR